MLQIPHAVFAALKNNMKLIYLPALFILFILSACIDSPQSQSLTIKDGEKRGRHIYISDISAKVAITGQVAETTLEITFKNSSSRVLEAMLDLPLPEGASVSRYALEVNGKMREGVIVDKQLGRVAFENTIRRGIDPGILEKTKGNRFRTRIYPVPARGSKRVILSYLEPLRSISSSSQTMSYTLPVSLRKRLNRFQLKMSASEASTIITPVITPAKELKGSTTKDDGSLNLSARNYRSKDLSFHITPAAGSSDAIIQRGRDGKSYFLLTDYHGKTTSYRRKSPRNILLVWDGSHSGRLRDLDGELALLDKYFGTLTNTKVTLNIIRNERSHAGTFSVTNGDWSSLRTTLTNLPYDGATRVDRLKLSGSQYDQIFYFGDGLSTLGDGLPRWGSQPISTVNSSPIANHILLSHLAHKTGGSYINLAYTTPEQALRSLTHQPITLLKVSGTGVSETILNTSAGSSTVSGRITSNSSTLKLYYGVAGKTHFTRTVPIKNRTSSGGKIAPQLWAQYRVNELSVASKKNRSQIVKLAKTHNLVTDYTSLIVLDRITDYVRYRIVPPEAAMKKEYYRRIKNVEAYDGGEMADLDGIYADWKNVVYWHSLKFPRPAGSRYRVNGNALPSLEVPFIGGGTTRRNSSRSSADFITPMAFSQIPGIPAGSASRVTNIVTAGLRSGDFAVTRNSIDAILNNPRPKPSPFKSRIGIKGWKPKSDYMRALTRAQKSGEPLFPVYYTWKKKYQQSPGFFLDVAEIFAQQKQKTSARRILSNIAEISPENPEMLRMLAHRYSQIGEYTLAEMLFREVIEMRKEEPQSHRDLALVLIQLKRYSEAERLLWKVISRKWDRRFYGIQMIVLNEWNWLHSRHGVNLQLRASQKRFRHRMDSDVRIIITWDTDNSDMDLWVTDPKGEKCYYANSLTKMGGRISRDITQGRGPEEFMIRRAPTGKYKIQANYYGTRQQTLIGPTTLHAAVITNWGRSNETRKHITIRLGKEGKLVEIGEVEFKR